MNPIIDWEKGTLEWRQPKTRKTILKREKQLRATENIVEEDREKHLNSTQNPLDESELSLLISSITGDTDDSAWCNVARPYKEAVWYSEVACDYGKRSDS